ncbi:MAG: MATE family efflux transporter [Bacilli bacterium]
MFKNAEMDLINGNTKELIKKIILYTLPIIFVGVLQLLYSSFDLICVQSHDGNTAAAAVGANGSLIALITNGFLGISTGTNVVIARYYGKKDALNARKSEHTSILLAIIGGIVIGIFGYFLCRYFLIWMNVDASYLDLATQYLKIYFVGLPFIAIYNFGAATFRGIGDTRKPLLILIITGVLNVGLNYLFVYGFNLGVAGVAWTTVISEAVSALVCLILLRRNTGFINFRIKELRIHKNQLIEILQIGVPSGIQGMVFSISNVILQSSLNTWGPEVVAANSDASNLEGYTYTSMFAVSQTSSSFTSANYGRGKKENIRKINAITLILVTIIGIVVGGITLLIRYPMMQFYMGSNFDETVYKYAEQRLFVILGTYFLCGLMDVECGVLRGLNYSISPLVITLFSCCIYRIIWNATVYSNDVDSSLHSLGVLYACYPISWILAFIAEIIEYFIIKKKVDAKMDINARNYLIDNQQN